MSKLKLMTIIGTRPEIIRLAAVIKKADKYFPLVEIIAVVVFVVALIGGGYIATKIMGKKNSRNKV